MPLVTFDEAYFERAYGPGGIKPENFDTWQSELIEQILIAELGMTLEWRILFFGGAYGYLAQYFIDKGYPAICTDSSPHINATKAQKARIPIHAEDARSNASRGRIRQTLGLKGSEKFDLLFTEDVIKCYSDRELRTGLLAAARSIAQRVVHWTTERPEVPPDQIHNWKMIEEWKEVVAPDFVMSRNTHRII